MIDSANATIALMLGVIGVAAFFSRLYFKRFRPWLHEREKDRIAQRDALIGRPPVLDSITGKQLAPALPGIGQRMQTVEGAIAELLRSNQRHEAHEAHLAKHDEQIADLQAGSVERIVARVESTAGWRAMEAATNATPSEETPPTSS